MSNVINRLTKQILYSVNTPAYPEPYWMIINDMTLPTCDIKYWVIEATYIREMDQAEKDEYLYTYESTIYLIAEKQLLYNKNGHDYESDANAIINPVMPNCELKYTKVEGGLVVEMTEEEKAVVDAPAIEKAASTQDIIDAYVQALIDLQAIMDAVDPTLAQVTWGVKTEAAILKKLLKFIRLNVVYELPT